MDNDSDDVKIQKIKSQTEKEMVAEKIRKEEEQEKKKELKEEIEKFKKGKFSKLLIISTIICGLFTTVEFNDGFSTISFIPLIQTILFILSWLIGMQIIKTEKKKIYYLFAILGFVLIIPYLNGMNSDTKDLEKINWENIKLNEILPKPKTKKGEIRTNSNESLDIRYYNVLEKNYLSYIEECKEEGFNIDLETDDNSFEAYNKKGYYLNIRYDEKDKEMKIELESPMEMIEDSFPTSDIAELLPKPKSSKGHLEWENSDSFLYYAGDTTDEDFKDYVDELIKKGFDVDFSKGDDYYYAYNKDGYYVSINFEGFSIMRIKISSPSDDTEDEETSSNDVEKNKETSSDDMVDGMRVEFKNAMDSYEEFIDEYVAFMKKYNKSDGSDLELIKDYTNYLEKYDKMVKAFEKWEGEDLNAKEEAYYLKVQTRVSKKLLEAVE